MSGERVELKKIRTPFWPLNLLPGLTHMLIPLSIHPHLVGMIVLLILVILLIELLLLVTVLYEM